MIGLRIIDIAKILPSSVESYLISVDWFFAPFRLPMFHELPLSWGEANQRISLFIQKEWQNEYAAPENESLYKTFSLEATTEKTDRNIPRKYSNFLFRINTWQCKLNEHLHRIECHPNGLYERCGTEETLQHYLFECPKYYHVRQQMTETAAGTEWAWTSLRCFEVLLFEYHWLNLYL